MDFSVSPIVAYILALSGTCGFIWFLFSKAEDTLKPKVKKDISKWLKNLDPVEPVKNWPEQFGNVFDRIFGERHVSWRCILYSFVASLVSVILLTLIWYSLRPDEFSEGFIFEENFPLVLLVFAAILNFLPDYLSLLESRYIISLMSHTVSNTKILVLLLFDLTISLAIAMVISVLYGYFIYWYLDVTFSAISETSPPSFNPRYFFDYLLNEVFTLKFAGVFFYSTFFTSVWVWLYTFSAFILKLAKKLSIGLTWFKGKLDIDEKPLRSMALVSIMIVTIIFISVPFLNMK